MLACCENPNCMHHDCLLWSGIKLGFSSCRWQNWGWNFAATGSYRRKEGKQRNRGRELWRAKLAQHLAGEMGKEGELADGSWEEYLLPPSEAGCVCRAWCKNWLCSERCFTSCMLFPLLCTYKTVLHHSPPVNHHCNKAQKAQPKVWF